MENHRPTGRGAALHAGVVGKRRSRSIIISQHDTPRGVPHASPAAKAPAPSLVFTPRTTFPHPAVNVANSSGARARQLFNQQRSGHGQSLRRAASSWSRTQTQRPPYGVRVPSQSSSSVHRARPAPATGGESAALRGFGNFGNTCYMNAVLACLMSLPCFVRCLLCDSTQQALKAAGADNVRLSSELTKLYVHQLARQVLASRRDGAPPPPAQRAEQLKATLSAACNRFTGYQQQDAHEFLLDLLAQLDSELGALSKPLAATAGILRAAFLPDNPNAHAMHAALYGQSADDEAKYPLTVPGGHLPETKHSQRALQQAVNPIRRCFVFQTRTSITCDSCQYTRSRADEHVCLSLNLGGNGYDDSAPQDVADARSGGAGTGVIDLDSDGDIPIPIQSSDAPDSANPRSAAASPESSLDFDTPVVHSTGKGQGGAVATPTAANTSMSSFDDIKTPLPNSASAPAAHHTAPTKAAHTPAPTSTDSDMLPLSGLLDAYFASESLELRCEQCSGGTHVTSHTSIAALPRVLIIQLNRFATDMRTGDTFKVHTPVPFPMQLSLTEHCFKGAPPGTAFAKPPAPGATPPVTVMAPPPLDIHDNATYAVDQRVRQTVEVLGHESHAPPAPAPLAATATSTPGSTYSSAVRRSQPIQKPVHVGSYHGGSSLNTLRAHIPGAILATGAAALSGGGDAGSDSTPDKKKAFLSIPSSESDNSVEKGSLPPPKDAQLDQHEAELWEEFSRGVRADTTGGAKSDSGHTHHISSRISSLPSRPVSSAGERLQQKRAREAAGAQSSAKQALKQRGWSRGSSQQANGVVIPPELEDEGVTQNLGPLFEKESKKARRGGLKGGEGGDVPSSAAKSIIDISQEAGDACDSPLPSSEEEGEQADMVRGVPLVGAAPLYECQAVVCHQGSGNAEGHYTCFARGLRNGRMQWGAADWEALLGWGHSAGAEAALRQAAAAAGQDAERKDNENRGSGGEQWWLYNDSAVRRADGDEVQGDAVMRRAYILAYVLKEPYGKAL